jgi:hypothetical protein
MHVYITLTAVTRHACSAQQLYPIEQLGHGKSSFSGRFEFKNRSVMKRTTSGNIGDCTYLIK